MAYESEPSKADILEFIRVWEKLWKHDMRRRQHAGYGALDESDDKSHVRVIDWLKELSQKTAYEDNDE
jgi:hypothetical protein